MCAIDYCDERFSVYWKRWNVTARKEHSCDECNRKIAKGEKYLYAFGVYDGNGDSYHTCSHCAVAVKWLTDNCGGFLHGGVLEDIEEHINDYPDIRTGLIRLAIGMKRRWRRFSADALMPIPPQAKAISVGA